MSVGTTMPADTPKQRRADRLAIAVLAVLAYLPALASSPGRMPADTKLYLYTDPGGLLGRAASTFEPDQLAGWVPHQQIAYLWPSGPWFWFFDQFGVPDWIAHRLWIGSILFAAGTGVWATARLLGLTRSAAVVAALAYQCSPYVLAYVSRTSLLLLPWAGFGWVMFLTVRATSTRRDGLAAVRAMDDGPRPRAWLDRWRDPALLALVIATIGSVNATTLLMIVPGPAVWLVTRPRADRNAAVAYAWRGTLLCLGVSLGWVAMVVVQARSGAPVLAFSETLPDVSRSATGSEVLRQLGYWLFYVRDVAGPATSGSLAYLTSLRVMALSYAIPLLGLAALSLVRWQHRRAVALLAFVGMLLSVGVHPIESPSPLMRLLTADATSTAALALRSSTRATPLFTLAIALGLGVGVQALIQLFGRGSSTGALPSSRGRLVAVAAGLLVVANLPVLWQRALVDPAIDRQADLPVAWQRGITDLQRRTDLARTLQLPGAEFGAFRWGYTVDQPLVGLAGRPIITRDLLPLGSAGAMDLLFALDDRYQGGIAEPAALAPVARLLGADSVWLANDLEFERFRTPLPAVIDAQIAGRSGSFGLGEVTRYGDAEPSTPRLEILDERVLGEPAAGRPVTPVALVDIREPGAVVRAKSESVVLAGSGDGILDAAAAGLLDGSELVRYSADLVDQRAAIRDASRVIITDSNRDRAHHWRGSQDVHGFTESGGADDDLLRTDPADQRLDVFGSDRADIQTIAVFDGPVRAHASSYGDPFAYLPEHRAAMAIDGDLTTSWIVGDHGNPVGERIELSTDSAVESIRLVQAPAAPGDRTIDMIRVTAQGRSADVSLDATSLTAAGQQIPLDTLGEGGSIQIEILSVDDTVLGTIGNVRGVGFAEIDLGLGPTREMIRPPIDLRSILADPGAADPGAADAGVQVPVDQVLTRLRTDPLDIWRSDPEPELQREVSLLEGPVTMTFDVRLDARAPDAVLAAVLGDTAVASRRLTGSIAHRGQAAVDGDLATSWLTPFEEVLGATLTWPVPARTTTAGSGPDSIVLTPATGDLSRITEVSLSTDSGSTMRVTLPADGGPTTVGLADLSDLDDGGHLTLTITAIDPRVTVDRRFGDRRVVPAGIAEISFSDRPALLPGPPALRSDVCRDDLVEVNGQPLGVTIAPADPDAPRDSESMRSALSGGDALVATPCTTFERPAPGTVQLVSVGRSSTGFTVDRAVIRQRGSPGSSPGAPDATGVRVVRNDARHRVVDVGSCSSGCWLVLGEGLNPAWRATIAGTDLGPPVQVDGGFNGWRLDPSDDDRVVELTWSAQRPVTIGSALAMFATILCLVLVALTRPRRRGSRRPGPAQPLGFGVRLGSPTLSGAAAAVLSAGALISPLSGAFALALVATWGAADRWARTRRSLLLVVPPLLAGAVALSSVWTLRSQRPRPDAGWTESFDHLHGLAVFAVFTLAWLASASREEDVESTPKPHPMQ